MIRCRRGACSNPAAQTKDEVDMDPDYDLPIVVLPGAFPGIERFHEPTPDEPMAPACMFFHAYCTGAIEKHLADRGLPAKKAKRSAR